MPQNVAYYLLSQSASPCPSGKTRGSPASSTLEGPVSLVAPRTAGDAFALALTLTDELKNDLYLFSEAQRLNFNGFRILIRTFV